MGRESKGASDTGERIKKDQNWTVLSYLDKSEALKVSTKELKEQGSVSK